MHLALAAALIGLSIATLAASGAKAVEPPSASRLALPGFQFASGERADVVIGYRTLGTPKRDRNGRVVNAVMLLHGTSGSGEMLLSPGLHAALLAPGKPLDLARAFVIVPDSIGAGLSSKPSDGLGAKFPHYTYADMVEANRALARAIGVEQLALVLGTSMGGMHVWLWATEHPDEARGFVALASLPMQVQGRNLLWRMAARDALLADQTPGGGGQRAATTITLLAAMPATVLRRIAPTAESLETLIKAQTAATAARSQPLDQAYQLDSVRGYDPWPKLGRITAPLLNVNFADDTFYPPELDPMPEAVRTAPTVSYAVVPASARTSGHMTLTEPEIWAPYVANAVGRALANR